MKKDAVSRELSILKTESNRISDIIITIILCYLDIGINSPNEISCMNIIGYKIRPHLGKRFKFAGTKLPTGLLFAGLSIRCSPFL